MAVTAPSSQLHRQVTVSNDLGLHVRPAAKIAAMAKPALGKVWVEADGEQVNAKDPLDIVSLMAPMGTTLIIRIETAQDMAILTGIVHLIENGFEDSGA